MNTKTPWPLLAVGTIGLLLIAGPWSRSTWREPVIPTFVMTVGEGVGAEIDGDNDGFHVTIHRRKGENPWQVRVDKRIRVERGRRYEATFTARAEGIKTLIVAVSQGQAPWENLGGYGEFFLTPNFQPVTLTFTASSTEEDARLTFVIGSSTGELEIAGPVRLQLVE